MFFVQEKNKVQNAAPLGILYTGFLAWSVWPKESSDQGRVIYKINL